MNDPNFHMVYRVTINPSSWMKNYAALGDRVLSSSIYPSLGVIEFETYTINNTKNYLNTNLYIKYKKLTSDWIFLY